VLEDVRPIFTLKEAAELHLAAKLVLELPPEILKDHAGTLKRANEALQRSIESAGGIWDGEEWRVADWRSAPRVRRR
jgi:hypothetical protein